MSQFEKNSILGFDRYGYLRQNVLMDIGIIEGFYGSPWEPGTRLSYAAFMEKFGGQFYLYAPKKDQLLRKSWRSPWPKEYQDFLRHHSDHFSKHGVDFGLGLSPFELGSILSKTDEDLIIEKLTILKDCQVKRLGIFFDDMKSHQDLSFVQMKVMDIAQKYFSGEIYFCPTYYSFDPILEKIFGSRPQNYWKDISTLSSKINIMWTGPKVISPDLSLEHLSEVREILQRHPFIWDNFFANDGPKNCQFLKLKEYHPVPIDFKKAINGIGFNLMNQGELSKILFRSSFLVINEKGDSPSQFKSSLCDVGGNLFAKFVLDNRELLSKNVNEVNLEERKLIEFEANIKSDNAFFREILGWINKNYQVDVDCLTD